jgi:hypothetical protein
LIWLRFELLSFLVSTAFCVLGHWLAAVCACVVHQTRVNLVLLRVARVLSLLWLRKVTLAPVNSFLFSLFDRCLALVGVYLLGLLFCLIGLVVTDLLVLTFRRLIEFTGTLVTGLAHLLAHKLTKSAVSTTVSESFLWLVCLFLC